jgi:hypothetical protein
VAGNIGAGDGGTLVLGIISLGIVELSPRPAPNAVNTLTHDIFFQPL